MKRYIFDPLYGIIYLPDFVWKVIPSTELQRLREIRLCNINSFCLTGGANINRYEHAIGTCYLAIECLKHWPALNPITKEENRQFVLAALLHDVLNAPFGHSVQYIESREGYEPEKDFRNVIVEDSEERYRYRKARLEPIFFGMPKELSSKVTSEDLLSIGRIIEGKGRFGPLVNGSIDLDNIDNVFRFSYHLGITKSGEAALSLARSMWIQKGEVVVKRESLPLVEHWYETRRKLYAFLLLNPEEFSAKCMLSEAFEFAKTYASFTFSWHDTDFEFLKKLSCVPPVKEDVKERLFEISGEFKNDLNGHIISKKLVELFGQNEQALSPRVTLNSIVDGWKLVDKTKVYVIVDKGEKLCVYKIIPRGIEISTIVKRLMKGELYGCIGIFSSAKTEKHALFEDLDKRREMENRISTQIRRKFAPRFSKAIVVFHLIKDIDKTERQVKLRTDDDGYAQIGKSSSRLLIGSFFRNFNLTMYDIDPYSETSKRVRSEIGAYLSQELQDPNLKELELYGEAGLNQ